MLQYIGARYVPIFYKNSLDPTSSEWEANVTYEPMTWVSLPNGYMYISKKTVPANIGTPAQNGEYWLEAGQYNAYIQSLQDQIDDMKDGNIPGSLQDQINDMKDGNIPGSLQDQINDINGQIPVIQSDISALDTKIDNLDNRYFLLVSDSYGIPRTGMKSWQEYIEDWIGATKVTRAYANGYGFKPDFAPSSTFQSLITPGANPTGVPSGFDTSKVTDIVVLGGYNDKNQSLSSLDSAIGSFCSYARSTYANLKRIYIGAAGWCMNKEKIQILEHGKYTIAYSWCGSHNAVYMAGIENIMRGFDLFIPEVDGSVTLGYLYVHPNDTGSKYLANAVMSYIFGGTYKAYYDPKVYQMTTDPNITVSNLTSIGITESLNGDYTTIIWGPGGTIKHADLSTFTLSASETDIKICNITAGLFNTYEEVIIPCEGLIVGGSFASNTQVDCILKITNGELHAVIRNTRALSGNFTTLLIFGLCRMTVSNMA